MITALAPGKLVILGEYAVLEATHDMKRSVVRAEPAAIVAAVNRGVGCNATPADTLIIEVPGGDDRFVRAALAGAKGQFSFFDWNPVDLGGQKAGFGGSAASVVAALKARADLQKTAFYWEEAVSIHGDVQAREGGRGSGIDIFASAMGGVRQFPSGESVKMPFFTAIWSGESAKTGPRVAQYLAWEGGARTQFVQESSALVKSFSQDPIGSVRAAYSLLCGMAQDARIAYDTPAHREIAALALEFGGAAKPSGAGGGDIAVAVFTDPAARSHFMTACAVRKLLPIPVSVAFPTCSS